MSLEVSDNPERHRFEVRLDGAVVGFADYRRRGEVVVLPHTEVDPELAGRGIGTELVRAALDALREQGATVVPACSFVRAFVERHGEYADLLAG